jgi:integrase
MVAATTALRRSEIRGLRWSDVDFESAWLPLRRGLVRKDQAKLKTKAPRKGVPMIPELVAALSEWRQKTPYPLETDWSSLPPSRMVSARTGRTPPSKTTFSQQPRRRASRRPSAGTHFVTRSPPSLARIAVNSSPHSLRQQKAQISNDMSA